jgi:hypothetical protein
MALALPGMPCMATMPGRRFERVTGSHVIPVTKPPAGLLKEMLLTSTPSFVDSTVFCRFSGALTSWLNRCRSHAVATPPKCGSGHDCRPTSPPAGCAACPAPGWHRSPFPGRRAGTRRLALAGPRSGSPCARRGGPPEWRPASRTASPRRGGRSRRIRTPPCTHRRRGPGRPPAARSPLPVRPEVPAFTAAPPRGVHR